MSGATAKRDRLILAALALIAVAGLVAVVWSLQGSSPAPALTSGTTEQEGLASSGEAQRARSSVAKTTSDDGEPSEGAETETESLEPGVEDSGEGQVRVLVVDESGRPVPDIQVALVVEPLIIVPPAVVATTNSDGLSTLVLRPQTWPTALRKRWIEEGEAEVWIHGLLPTKLTKTVRRNELPTEPLRMVLPACGSLRVHLQDADGLPLHESASVILRRSRVGYMGTYFLDWSKELKPKDKGVVTFFPVAFGLDLRVNTSLPPTSRFAIAGVRAPFVTEPGEIVDLELRAEHPLALVRARITDDKGEVLPHYDLDIFEQLAVFEPLTSGAIFDMPSSRITSDAEGRIEYAVGRPNTALPGAERFILLRPAGTELGVATPEARRSIGKNPNGTLDLGEIALAPAPLVLAGRVVNDLGIALSGVDIDLRQLQSMKRWTANSPFPWGLIRQATSDEEGRFVIRGHLPEAANRVLARPRKENHQGDMRDFDKGADDVEMVLPRPAGIRVRYETPDPLPLESWSLALTPTTDDGTRGHTEFRTTLGAEGKYSRNDVFPGRYSLELFAPHISEPLDVSDPIELRAGETLDLGLRRVRHELHGYAFKVLNEPDEEWTTGNFLVFEKGSKESSLSGSFFEHEFSFLFPHDEARVRLSLRGHAGLNLDLRPGTTSLRFPSAWSATVKLRGKLPKLPGLSSYRVQASSPPGTERGARGSGSGDLDQEQSAQFKVSAPGTYEVKLYIDLRLETGMMTGRNPKTLVGTFHIDATEDRASPRQFTFDTPPALVTEIEELIR